jgi:hypothetical protein
MTFCWSQVVVKEAGVAGIELVWMDLFRGLVSSCYLWFIGFGGYGALSELRKFVRLLLGRSGVLYFWDGSSSKLTLGFEVGYYNP